MDFCDIYILLPKLDSYNTQKNIIDFVCGWIFDLHYIYSILFLTILKECIKDDFVVPSVLFVRLLLLLVSDFDTNILPNQWNKIHFETASKWLFIFCTLNAYTQEYTISGNSLSIKFFPCITSWIYCIRSTHWVIWVCVRERKKRIQINFVEIQGTFYLKYCLLTRFFSSHKSDFFRHFLFLLLCNTLLIIYLAYTILFANTSYN